MKHTYRCTICRSQVRLAAVSRVIAYWCYFCRKTTEHHRES